jgi:hypothetical protein
VTLSNPEITVNIDKSKSDSGFRKRDLFGAGREGEPSCGRRFYRNDSEPERKRIQSDLLGTLVHDPEESIGGLRV